MNPTEKRPSRYEVKAHFYNERAEELRTIAENQTTVDGRVAWLLLAHQAQRYADWHAKKEREHEHGNKQRSDT